MSVTLMKLNNTYKITTIFRSFATDVPTDCTGNVLLKIYDVNEVQVGSSTTSTKTATGTYTAYYTPTAKGLFFWTMSGTMDGSAVLDSGEIRVSFV